MNLQSQLFEIILARFARKADCVDVLCRVLNSSKDPVYRRLRGDTPLPPEELAALARHFNISLDALIFGQSDSVRVSFNDFADHVTSFSDYLENYIADLQQIQRLPNARLFYASSEVPVFSYMYLPELISFKLYVWGRTTWNLEYLRHRPFDFELVTPPVIRLAEQVLEHYNSLPTTELWSLGIVDNTLAQIEYHVQSGGFRDNSDALVLCDKMLVWAEHMKQMATVGKKFNLGSQPHGASAAIDLFHNEIVHTSNTILVVSDVAKVVYAAFSNPNFIKSTDAKMCDYVEGWFGNVIAKSAPISLNAEKSRDWFFRGLVKKIETVKRRIEAQIRDEE